MDDLTAQHQRTPARGGPYVAVPRAVPAADTERAGAHAGVRLLGRHGRSSSC